MEDFLNRKTAHSRKPWSEAEVLERLRNGELKLPPLELRLIESEPATGFQSRPDGILEVHWKAHAPRFVFEYKPLSTPKAIDTAMIVAKRHHLDQTDLLPMIIVPYLSEERLRLLEREGVSGIDLSGNGVIIAPDLVLWRSGQPNLFRDSQPIKNVYRGSSSILSRCFLLQPQFESLGQLRDFALMRLEPDGYAKADDDRLRLGTVSKVVQALEQELIVKREQKRMRLIDPQLLLTQLRTNYRPSEGRRLEGKTPLPASEVWQRLQSAANKGSLRRAATGIGSASRYGLLSMADKLSIYVTDLDDAASLLEVTPSRVFPNIELVEEKSDLVYFDARKEDEAVWASPIQIWIELSVGGPRERDAAHQLEAALTQGRTENLL